MAISVIQFDSLVSQDTTVFSDRQATSVNETEPVIELTLPEP